MPKYGHRKKTNKVKYCVVDPNQKRWFVYRGKYSQFAEKHGIKVRALKALIYGEKIGIGGWLSPVHPKFKEALARAKIYLINTKTHEIIKKPWIEDTLCPVMGVNHDCLNKLIRGEIRNAKGWMVLEQYELIYGKLDKKRLCEARRVDGN